MVSDDNDKTAKKRTRLFAARAPKKATDHAAQGEPGFDGGPLAEPVGDVAAPEAAASEAAASEAAVTEAAVTEVAAPRRRRRPTPARGRTTREVHDASTSPIHPHWGGWFIRPV